MVNISTKKRRDKPQKKTFKVYDIFEIRDYLITKNQFTEEEFHTFWCWWGDGDSRTGPCDRSLRNVSLGYWGWTDEKPYRQLTADEYRAQNKEERDADDESPEDEAAIHKVLTALLPFADAQGDLLVYMAW